MKLTDFLTDVGRPVAYYPKMKRITGGTTATILLCQFIYWRGKEADTDGWLYKTSEEIEEETGLTYNEQKTARKELVYAGLIQEHYARLDHKMRFLVNLDVINEKWGIAQPIIPESDDSMFGNDEIPQSLNESENTTQTTTDEPSKKGDIVDGLLFFGNQAKERKEDKLEELICEIERGLHVNITRTNANQNAARRILKDGRPFDRWLTWCISDEWRAAHLYIYADLDKIWQVYPQAFEKKTDEQRPAYAPIPERKGIPRPANVPPPNIPKRSLANDNTTDRE